MTDSSLTSNGARGMFGLPTRLATSALVYIPVPWEVTSSYGSGAAKGCEAILQASPQLDLFLKGLPNYYEQGFHLAATSPHIQGLNQEHKSLAQQVMAELENSGTLAHRPDLIAARKQINSASQQLNDWLYGQCQHYHQQGKQLAVIGGDHSSPLALIQFLSEHYQGDFGVLHIDAHFDLRNAYQGFRYSHASIMNNVMALPQAPQKLVHVAIRDFCQEEYEQAESDSRIAVFYDEEIKAATFNGESFASVVEKIVAQLPQNVYISFDIDGLQPAFCPSTGTPVAGGLSFSEAQFLLKQVAASGKKIIGFDLCEVCPNPNNNDEWDGNVGARLLLLLSTLLMASRH